MLMEKMKKIQPHCSVLCRLTVLQ